jgi:cold shock protein
VADTGTIRVWHIDDGWGVVDCAATPGGCWAHFSAAAVHGYRAFAAGQAVTLEWETPGQDGYQFRATSFWPEHQEPVRDDPGARASSGAYRSALTLSFDPPEHG